MRFTKLTLEFLERIEKDYPAPWSTIASDAILWKDEDKVKFLFNKFLYCTQIYEKN